MKLYLTPLQSKRASEFVTALRNAFTCANNGSAGSAGTPVGCSLATHVFLQCPRPYLRNPKLGFLT
ncbi:hypothetical protein PR003_g4744 [Phytophthora rubi]|uniref:Uncharacterized protein n=1 Tax=Phytophthora rubi TaxID=129364 RepID=A0A6A3NXT3_9STRA|nr:hypothetical protein PR001_g4693 [Phytophthora rubi]KAE9351750.1 hypothetical protein PR003_g4744 [Phytophthora rubi]